jgi:hypothetical protein
METGNLAAQALLQTYIHGNRNSLAKAVRAWAPPSENDTAKYLDFMEANTDIPRDRPLTDSDIPKILQSLYRYEGNGAALAVLHLPPSAKAVRAWAPPSENDTARYLDFMEANTDIPRDRPLTDSDIPKILQSLYRYEGNGAALAVLHLPPSGASMRHVGSVNHVTASSTIGSIVINTRATDGTGIAATIAPALKNSANNLVWAANTGVQ